MQPLSGLNVGLFFAALITVIEVGYGGVRNLLAGVVLVHQHILGRLRMAVFGAVFASFRERAEEMSRLMSHRTVGPALADYGDALFGNGGAFVVRLSVRHFWNHEERQQA